RRDVGPGRVARPRRRADVRAVVEGRPRAPRNRWRGSGRRRRGSPRGRRRVARGRPGRRGRTASHHVGAAPARRGHRPSYTPTRGRRRGGASGVPALQATVRDRLANTRSVELGIVTQTFTNDGGSGDNNIAIGVRIRGSALELQHVPVAVGRLGVSVSPRVGDLAVLAFVGGDVNSAVAIGFLYDEQTR